MRYEPFKVFIKFAKNRRFKTDFVLEKTLGEFFNEKCVSAHQIFSDFFKQMVSKTMIQDQKLEKYIKSKNALKSALGAVNQEIWTI